MKNMISKMAFLVAVLAIAGSASEAQASCYCACLNGVNQPFCTSTVELRPLCGPVLCPLVPPSLRPLMPLSLPPIGTRYCSMEQVWNKQQRRYTWLKVCR